jgi:C1A family cysteine protease
MCDLIDTPPQAVDAKEGVGIDTYDLLPKGTEVKSDGTLDIRDTRTLERLLQEGHDIVFGTIVAWRNADAANIIDVRLGPSGQPLFGAGGHAMVIAGFRRSGEGTDNRPFFIVKNSWGTSYGHDGYLYLTYDYIRTYAKYGYTTTRLKKGKVSLQ